jgi:CheY-like chemotaxis protein
MNELIAAERHVFYFLVIDNSVDDRFRTSMLLQRFGYHISTASSSEEAMDLMRVTPPAVLIVDDINIANLLSDIQKDNRFSEVPVIMLAQPSNPDERARACREQVAACLAKPLDAEQFYRTVQSVVEKTPRENIRIETCLSAWVEGGADRKGVVTVISKSGLFFQTESPLKVNTRTLVRLEINNRSITLEAVVLYRYSLEEAGPLREPGMGMKFVAIKPEDQIFINSYILEHIAEDILRLDR